MKVAVAIDSFKGSMTSMQAGNCRLPRLLTQQGLTTIERVDDAG